MGSRSVNNPLIVLPGLIGNFCSSSDKSPTSGNTSMSLILIVLGEVGGSDDDGELTVDDRETISKT